MNSQLHNSFNEEQLSGVASAKALLRCLEELLLATRQTFAYISKTSVRTLRTVRYFNFGDDMMEMVVVYEETKDRYSAK